MADVRTMPPVWTVSSLTAAIKCRLEKDFHIIDLEGEISGWKPNASGHIYFSLKDAGAQISAVMFAGDYLACPCRNALKDGVKIKIRGSVSVFAPRGNYQIIVRRVKLLGEGDLMQKYLELKSKLESEGIFDRSRKRKLPFMPRRIGIVTSETGAVIHDMCTVMTRRFPVLEIRLFPSAVQGDGAAKTIIAGINYFNSSVDWRADVLIVARGGGSFEDLFCFNDEELVRVVANSSIPIVSAVGHETDFTLCDFAADVRAGTPSIAAEISVPIYEDIKSRLDSSYDSMATALKSKVEWYAQRVDQLSDALRSSLTLARSNAENRLSIACSRLAPSIAVRIASAKAGLDGYPSRFAAALALCLERNQSRLKHAESKLSLLSPYSVLDRGYSLTTTTDGKVVRDAFSLKVGDVISTRFSSGKIESVVC